MGAVPPDEPRDVAEDRLLGGRVRLRQPRRGHRAGTDAVLLARFAGGLGVRRVADVGAGTGAVGLMLAALRPGVEVLLVERDPGLVALCRENVALNGHEARARAVEADVLAPAAARRRAGLARGAHDLVVTNPPFANPGEARASPDPARAAAHVIGEGGLDAWIRACADLLVPKGRLALIHRADKLRDCLEALAGCFGALAIRPVHPRADLPATRILVTGVKGSRAPLALLPGLAVHEADGRMTPGAEALHRGEPAALADAAPPGATDAA